MNVGEICNREVIILGSEASLADAVKLMRGNHVGNVVIVEEKDGQNVPIGILTDRDVVIEVLAEEVDMGSVAVKDVMSYDLLTAHDQDDVSDTLKRMRAKGIRRMPVIDGEGGLLGIVSVDDIIDVLAEQLKDLAMVISREQVREQLTRK